MIAKLSISSRRLKRFCLEMAKIFDDPENLHDQYINQYIDQLVAIWHQTRKTKKGKCRISFRDFGEHIQITIGTIDYFSLTLVWNHYQTFMEFGELPGPATPVQDRLLPALSFN